MIPTWCFFRSLIFAQFNTCIADSLHLKVTEASWCKGPIIENEIQKALKKITTDKIWRIDGFFYKLYLKLS